MAGQAQAIRNILLKINAMPKKNDKGDKNQKLQQVVDLLRFLLTLDDDEEIIKSTIESVIEVLEEEINK